MCYKQQILVKMMYSSLTTNHGQCVLFQMILDVSTRGLWGFKSSLAPCSSKPVQLAQASVGEGPRRLRILLCFLGFLAEGSISWIRAKRRRKTSDSCCSKGKNSLEMVPRMLSDHVQLGPQCTPEWKCCNALCIQDICSLFFTILDMSPWRKIIYGAMILLIAKN